MLWLRISRAGDHQRPALLVRSSGNQVARCAWAVASLLALTSPLAAQQQQDREPLPYQVPKPAYARSRDCRLPTWADMRKDPVVDWALKKAIHDTIVEPRGSSLVTEEGGWVYQCQVQEGPGPVEYYYDVAFSKIKSGGSVDLQDKVFRAHMPSSPSCRTVGTFHTHPSISDRKPTEWSEVDASNAERRGVPALILKNRTRWQDARSQEVRWDPVEFGGWNENGRRNLTWDCGKQACGEPGFDGYRVSAQLPASAGQFATPVAGANWNVTNYAGRMVCNGFAIPLPAATSMGTIEVRDQGRVLVGTGFDEGTAPITMYAVPGLTGRYSGSVGGERDGIPMTINFCWQLVTDEWITGYLRSDVEARGMVCNMSRDFEMRTDGPAEQQEADGEIPIASVSGGASTG